MPDIYIELFYRQRSHGGLGAHRDDLCMSRATPPDVMRSWNLDCGVVRLSDQALACDVGEAKDAGHGAISNRAAPPMPLEAAWVASFSLEVRVARLISASIVLLRWLRLLDRAGVEGGWQSCYGRRRGPRDRRGWK